MGEILFTTVTFLVAISVLIAVHEFGHFWVAKKLGVKVLRYSIGFGKPIWKKTAGPDKTEYVIAALPLGGYVKMLDEREGEVPDGELHRAFNRQHVWKRFAIVFAGPAFNFIFAIFAYWLVIVLGVTGFKPIIGDIYPDSPAAQAGLKAQMEIISVAGRKTPIWDAVFQETILKVVDKERLLVTTVNKSGLQHDYYLDLSGLDLDRDVKQLFKALGIKRYQQSVPAIIGKVIEGDPADKAGIKVGDRIFQLDDKSIKDWQDLATYISQRPSTVIKVGLMRGDKKLYLELTTKSVTNRDKQIGRVGVVNKTVKLDKTLIAEYNLDVASAIPYSIRKTWDMSLVTVKLMGKMLVGDISIKNISGPLNIAVVIGDSAELGLVYFLTVVAVISISLGVLNLLPVPVLDGGHLMFYIVEMIKGSPVPEYVEALGQRIGIMLLLMLMVFALYNDVMRFV